MEIKLNKKNIKLFIISGIIFGIFFIFTSKTHAENSEDKWSGDIFIGYNRVTGNTDQGSGSLSFRAIKSLEKSKLDFKLNAFYSESDKKKDGQKLDGLVKYSYDFGIQDKWFSFYQFFAEHDYFADIDYRLTPAMGFGYHIYNLQDLTWDVNAGLGYKITRHRVNKNEDDEVLVGLINTFIRKKVFENAFLSENLTVYPSLESSSGVLIKSETAFTNPLRENLDLELRYIIDYDSKPAKDKKKTDTQIIVGIKYNF